MRQWSMLKNSYDRPRAAVGVGVRLMAQPMVVACGTGRYGDRRSRPGGMQVSLLSVLQSPIAALSSRRRRRAAQSAVKPDTPDPEGDLAAGRFSRHMSSEDFLDSLQDRA